jgi:hypothetical protein
MLLAGGRVVRNSSNKIDNREEMWQTNDIKGFTIKIFNEAYINSFLLYLPIVHAAIPAACRKDKGYVPLRSLDALLLAFGASLDGAVVKKNNDPDALLRDHCGSWLLDRLPATWKW